MKEQYTILKMKNNKWKEIGKIVRKGKYFILLGFNKEDEVFFSEIGYGEIGVKPKDGDLYLKALADILSFSSTMDIRKDK